MGLKSICSIGFLLILLNQTVIANEDYFEKSIFRALKDEGGQFSSEITQHFFYNSKAGKPIDVTEMYNFKLNAGQTTKDIGIFRNKYNYVYLYRNHANSSELHQYDTRHKFCYSTSFRRESNYGFLRFWPMDFILKSKVDFKVLGPSMLIEVLLDNYRMNKTSVECVDLDDSSKKNPKKCSITMNEARLDYEFVDRDEHTMYPEKITAHLKNETTCDWNLHFQVTYLNFTSLFGQESIVSLNLPIGMGCKRLNHENYPKHQPRFGDRFELEQEVLFNYREKIVTNDLNNQTNDNTRTIVKKNITRTYSNKMYVDLVESINVADTTDEVTNVSIRTFYDMKTDLLHSVSLDDDKCSTYNLTSDKSTNWFYIQDTFVKKPHLYYTKDNYSYLGEYNVGDVPCLVFEKDYYLYRSEWERWGKPSSPKSRKTSRQNKNNLRPSIVFSTHYYPKDANYWSTDSISVPLKIEFRFFKDYHFRTRGNMTISFKSFNPNPNKYEKYDSSKCIEMD